MPQTILVSYTRDLTQDDVHDAETMERNVYRPVKNLRERHHRMAQMVALGMKAPQIAAELGLSTQTIFLVRQDPSFQELVRHYRSMGEAEFVDAQKHLLGLNKDVILELRQRLEEMPDDFSIGQLTTLLTVTADRTGNGPSSKSEVNVTVGLADRLAEARRRIAQQRTIDITPTREAAE